MEAPIKLLTNPVMLRMFILFVGMAIACIMMFFTIRHMRRSMVEESPALGNTPPELFSLHTYHAVIQQLKQQKHELISIQQVERRRAKTSENVSAAVLSNLSMGVMFFASNGLIRQANTAAKEILGYASPVGMNATEVFAHAIQISNSRVGLVDAIHASVRQPMPPICVEVEHVTPRGDIRILRVTVTPVLSVSGEPLGAACLIDDRTEVAKIRKEQELHGEMSAEMALELRNSLATISGYGRQLAVSRDPELARQLATDIASEASHLDHTIGGFLAGRKTSSAKAGSSS